MPTVEPTLTAAAIATLVSATVATIVTVLVARYNQFWLERRALTDLVQQINMLNIQYPYFEDLEFIRKYGRKKRKSEAELRYESYCIIIFNFLERLGRFHSFKLKKMAAFVHVEEMVLPHSEWWIADTKENHIGYHPAFVGIVNKILEKSK